MSAYQQGTDREAKAQCHTAFTHVFEESDRNGIQLVPKCLLHQGLTQCPTWFRHEGDGFRPPLLDPGFDTVGPRRIDE